MNDSRSDETLPNAIIHHIEGLRFRVSFGVGPDLVLDEGTSPGGETGPDATQLLASAIGSSLSAGLTRSLGTSGIKIGRMRTNVALTIAHDFGRPRITRGEVRVTIALEPTAALERCLESFQESCMVTTTLRQAFPIDVIITDPAGRELFHSARELSVASP